MADLKNLIQSTPGPILVLGANGFIGWNFFQILARARPDVFGLARRPNWRTDTAPELHSRLSFENQGDSFTLTVQRINPVLILDLAAYGAYPDQQDSRQIVRTNYERVQNNLQHLETQPVRPMYLLAGSSSEYGFKCDAAPETEAAPNSLYALSKVAAARLIEYFGKQRNLPCLHLRLFSVYGTFETPTRLIPQLAIRGLKKEWPQLSSAGGARDFVHVDDVLRAFLMCAQKLNQTPDLAGEIFNVGTGRQLTLKEVTEISRKILNQNGAPAFGSSPGRSWDQNVWVANIDKIRSQIGWLPQIIFERGLETSVNWWRSENAISLDRLAQDPVKAVTADLISVIVAVHRDEQSLRPLYERVRKACSDARVQFELIFVNDRSPDGSLDLIRDLSLGDARVVGLNHAANAGSQQAFWTGLAHARGQACILMDGDLQDPPELIFEFVKQWRTGHQIVLGRRKSREMKTALALGHKIFYRLANRFSGTKLPLDVGDFSLMDRQVVDQLLKNQPRTLWIRGMRSQLGYEPAFVDYHRPERPHGRSTNSIGGLIGWAYQGIFLFQGEPLRRWNRWMAFLALPVCFAAYFILHPKANENWPQFSVQILGFMTLLMMSEVLVALYRQSLGAPRTGIESRIVEGKIEKWKRS